MRRDGGRLVRKYCVAAPFGACICGCLYVYGEARCLFIVNRLYRTDGPKPEWLPYYKEAQSLEKSGRWVDADSGVGAAVAAVAVAVVLMLLVMWCGRVCSLGGWAGCWVVVENVCEVVFVTVLSTLRGNAARVCVLGGWVIHRVVVVVCGRRCFVSAWCMSGLCCVRRAGLQTGGGGTAVPGGAGHLLRKQ